MACGGCGKRAAAAGKRAAQAATANAKPTLAKTGEGVAYGPTRWSGTRRAAQENT